MPVTEVSKVIVEDLWHLFKRQSAFFLVDSNRISCLGYQMLAAIFNTT